MIKIEHVVLPSPEQMEFVIEGMRNLMNSWDKSDSDRCDALHACDNNDRCTDCPNKNKRIGGNFAIGPNDHDLMQCLANAGSDYRKFMCMMPVMARITAPLYWWKQFDTYKVGTVTNSCSIMHKITEKEFTLDDFSGEHIFDDSGNDYYFEEYLEDTIIALNHARLLYLDYASRTPRLEWDRKTKQVWWQMIQLLPSSYNQTRNVMLNYEVLANIYPSRKGHKLDEWVEFCKWIETLPYSELITGMEAKR